VVCGTSVQGFGDRQPRFIIRFLFGALVKV
jgi:hypothetical protein